ncbi:MFS transporter [Cupriavidus basilensis]
MLDGSIANIALPSISRELASDPSSTIWVVNAYQLTVTVCLLPLSSLGDILGYKRVYRIGLAVFLVGSLLCALSPSLPVLVAARVVQGIGGAGIMSVNTALVRFIYPPTKLGRGIGLNALVVGITIAVGPSVGALILSIASWPWLFAVNVPVAILALALARTALPRDAAPAAWLRLSQRAAIGRGVRLVHPGCGRRGPCRVAACRGGRAGGGCHAGLVAGAHATRQAGAAGAGGPVRQPLVHAGGGYVLLLLMAQMLSFVALPFYLEYQLGRSLHETGLLITPWPLMVAIMAPLSGRLSDRYPASVLAGIGLTLLGSGLVGLALLGPDASALPCAGAWRCAGWGSVCSSPPNNRAMIGATPPARSGGASGAQATTRLLGQTTGLQCWRCCSASIRVALRGWRFAWRLPLRGLGRGLVLVGCGGYGGWGAGAGAVDAIFEF